MIREKRLSPRASRSESRLPLSPRRTQGSPKTTPYPPAASAERRQTTKQDSLLHPVSTLLLDARLRSARLAAAVRLSPTARLQRKSTVCGLSGLRPGFAGSPPIKSSTRLGHSSRLLHRSLFAPCQPENCRPRFGKKNCNANQFSLQPGNRSIPGEQKKSTAGREPKRRRPVNQQ